MNGGVNTHIVLRMRAKRMMRFYGCFNRNGGCKQSAAGKHSKSESRGIVFCTELSEE